MPLWDVFHSERLEAERSLTTRAVRDAIARGDLGEDDLVRPAGETRWGRLGDSPDFADFASSFEAPPDDIPAQPPPPFEPASIAAMPVEAEPPIYEEFEVVYDEDEDEVEEGPSGPVLLDEEAARPDLAELDNVQEFAAFHAGPVEDPPGPADEDEDDGAEFTLSRNSTETVEELDLAAMVDVAFQLVLFFLVTAQVVLFKTLEVPRPNEDKPPEAAAQARTKSVDELEKDYILVEVDAAGMIKVDRQAVTATRPALMERLRSSRETTARKAMLLSADFATRHENAVLVFDVANEIDLKIAIAQPTGKK